MSGPGFSDRDVAKVGVDMRVALAACDAEMKTAHALGAGWFEAYDSGYRVLDEILNLSREPECQMVLTRFKMIGW